MACTDHIFKCIKVKVIASYMGKTILFVVDTTLSLALSQESKERKESKESKEGKKAKRATRA